MEYIKTLQSIGLSENQAKVYMACLQLGESSVLHISRVAGLKRPSVYLLLSELERMGLVSKAPQKKTAYRAMAPERIVADQTDKLEAAREILPSLKAIYNLNPEKPVIKIAETLQEVQAIYNGIFTYLRHHPDEELLIYGSLKDALGNFKVSVVDYFYEIMEKSHNPIREIGNDDLETRQYFKKSVRLNPRHQLRLLRNEEEGQFMQADNMIYGNTLVLFSVKKEIFAITIESAGVAETYRTLFNMAWRSGKSL